nr:MAG TPA: hypothetical protein [Caudoviricetes sp.]
MRKPQGVASLALGYELHWAFSPPLLNSKLASDARTRRPQVSLRSYFTST